MSALDRVLERLDNVRAEGKSYKASCPVPTHGQSRGDRDPSLNIDTDSEGNVLLKCFANCENETVVEALGLTMADLFERRNGSGNGRAGGGGAYTPPKSRSTHQPSDSVTLENYAAYVGLPVEFLKGLGLREIRYLGEPAVRMPYLDGSGEEVLLIRFRVSLTGKPKVKTKSGDKHRLYGLWKLEEARDAGYAFLMEGESDCQTLWFHSEPGAGIPGANGWKPEWASDLEGIGHLYFVVEDEAGEACWEKLAATPEIRERLYRVDLEGVKDVSELHKQDPGNFRERLRKARDSARAWLDIAETEEQERARESWAACRDLAESPDILAEFVRDLERCGLVGETRNAKLLYLALTSRVLEKIVSIAVKGPSSAGKSFLVKKVLGFFPESACWSFSRMSEKTLFYTEEPLSHRHLFFAEAAGVGGDFQDYIIRTLLSEGFLEYEFVEKTADGLKPRRIRKDGPTGFITTTTRSSLFWENETRYLSLTVTDTRDQTRRVFRAISEAGEAGAEEPDLARWRALQVWLEGSERRVSVPYARELAEKMGDVAVRLRRDFSVILSLIRAHALLHQATRERDGDGRIVSSIEDYARIRELVADLVAEGVEATVPPIVRQTVKAVERLIRVGDEEHATNRAVAEVLKIDKAAASRRVRVAVDQGYLRNLEDRKGRPARLVVGESMPEDTEILPLPEDLEEVLSGCAVDRDFEGIQHPPPPTSANGSTRQGGGGLIPLLKQGQRVNTLRRHPRNERGSRCECHGTTRRHPVSGREPRSRRRAAAGGRAHRRGNRRDEGRARRAQAQAAQAPYVGATQTRGSRPARVDCPLVRVPDVDKAPRPTNRRVARGQSIRVSARGCGDCQQVPEEGRSGMRRKRKKKLTASELQELEERELQRFKTTATEHPERVEDYLEAVEEFDRAIREHDEGAPELRDAADAYLEAKQLFEHGAGSGR